MRFQSGGGYQGRDQLRRAPRGRRGAWLVKFLRGGWVVLEGGCGGEFDEGDVWRLFHQGNPHPG